MSSGHLPICDVEIAEEEPSLPHHLVDENLVRSNLANYLAGKQSLQEFTEWFVTATWDIESWATASLRKLAYGIDLRLAEYTSKHRTVAELRSLLQPFVSANGTTAGAGSRRINRRRFTAPSSMTLDVPIAPVKALEALEEQIDDCLSVAKRLGKDELQEVVTNLRRARNAVVLKMGE